MTLLFNLKGPELDLTYSTFYRIMNFPVLPEKVTLCMTPSVASNTPLNTTISLLDNLTTPCVPKHSLIVPELSSISPATPTIIKFNHG